MAYNKKSLFLAGLLSLIIPGLGQAYNGHIKKGFTILVLFGVIWFIYSTIYAICLLIYALTELVSIEVIVVPLLVPLIINIIAAFDAIKKAELSNKGVVLKDWFD